MNKTDVLQALCRSYLSKLRPVAAKFGLHTFVDETIKANEDGRCVSTQEEVELLSRAVDDERIARKDIPKILGKSYRQCVVDNDFASIKRLKHTGIYSKISTIIHKNKLNK